MGCISVTRAHTQSTGGLNKIFPFKPVAISRLKNAVCPTIINMKGNVDSHVQDLNLASKIHFLRR